MDFSERDIARIFVSLRLKEATELHHLRVATPGHDGEPTALLREVGELAAATECARDAAVAYARVRGASWAQIGEACGSTAHDAEVRWGPIADADRRLDHPEQSADLLDRWYIHHVTLEDPLGCVRDAFSRILDGAAAPQPSHCLICHKYEHGAVPAWAGTPNPPGGRLYEDDLWRAGHGPPSFWPAGTILIESKRHFLDYSEFNALESASFGPLVGRLIGAVKAGTSAKRVHVFSSMDGAPHFHIWLIPRVSDAVLGKRFLTTHGNCTRAEAEEMMRRIRRAFEEASPAGSR